MADTPPGLDADWLSACRRATEGLQAMLAQRSAPQRAAETGSRGSGGDWTLEIDAAAEAIVLEQLSGLHERGYRFTVVSEELGEADFGGGPTRVVVDPIDGSLNAKREVPHHALSIAVADGATVADVRFGYVYDFGTREEWWAFQGQGAFRDGVALDPEATERRARDGRLEMLGLESADPRWLVARIEALASYVYRIRALGAIASTLCEVAAARFDAMLSLRPCRSVDAAAGQLIVREAGGVVGFPGFGLDAPLDLVAHAPVFAARSEQTLRELEELLA